MRTLFQVEILLPRPHLRRVRLPSCFGGRPKKCRETLCRRRHLRTNARHSGQVGIGPSTRIQGCFDPSRTGAVSADESVQLVHHGVVEAGDEEIQGHAQCGVRVLRICQQETRSIKHN